MSAVKKAKVRNLPFRNIDPATTKIVVPKDAENPFREGTATHKRVQAVLKANGKVVDLAVRAGARLSTVRYLARAKVIKLVTK
jgi:hypothetical protein